MAESPLAPSWLPYRADPNALAAGVWPTGAHRDASGALVLGGVAAPSLVAEFGSPLYVIDEAQARRRARELRESFESAFAAVGGEVDVYYAGKALLTADIARWMIQEGLRIDTCSLGELMVALAGQAPAALLGAHGNTKSDAYLTAAIAEGIGTIVIDNASEVERISRIAAHVGRRQRVRLRVRNGVHAHTHEFLATASEDQKFGVSMGEAPGVVARIRELGEQLEFVGLHCHIGSQIFGTEGFTESARRLIALHAELLRGGPVPELNLGGGFGIAYTPDDTPVPLAEMAQGIARTVAEACSAEGIALPRIAIEPGRAIIGTAGVTLYTVGDSKEVEVALAEAEGAPAGATGTAIRRYVGVDGGMSDNARPALYGADYTAALASRSSGAEAVLMRVVGHHCESGDIVVRDDYLPGDLQTSDLLAVADTGAYCFSLASNYNYTPRAALVAVRDGAVRELVRRETIDDLLARDAGYEGPRSSARNGAA